MYRSAWVFCVMLVYSSYLFVASECLFVAQEPDLCILRAARCVYVVAYVYVCVPVVIWLPRYAVYRFFYPWGMLVYSAGRR